jgi:hypothetical protein
MRVQSPACCKQSISAVLHKTPPKVPTATVMNTSMVIKAAI